MQPVMFDQYGSGQGTSSMPSSSFSSNDPLQFYAPPTNMPTADSSQGLGQVSTSASFGPGASDFNSFGSGVGDLSGSMGGSMSSSASGSGGGFGSSPFDDEPPLLEELGINFKDIWTRTLAVSLPFRTMPTLAEDDADLAGPLVFCMLLGTCLLMAGKVHFGYIYGFGVVGCLLMYLILNLMSDEAISVDRTMSILGYSLLPIVLLAIAAIIVDLRGTLGFVLACIVIAWCTLSATRLFEKALSMKEQRYLVAYPVTMLYACFALLTIF